MKKLVYRIITLIISCSMLSLTIMYSPALANNFDEERNYKIDSVYEFYRSIKKANADGQITKAERKSLINNTDPDVCQEYAEKEVKRALNYDFEFELTADSQGTITKDIGNGTSIKLSYTDEEDNGIIAEIGDKVTSLFCQEAYAETCSETVTKEYGNRKCTHKFTVSCFIGSYTLSFTNHYNLSSAGITERYGESDVSGGAFLTTISDGDPYITTEKATKSGDTASMKCEYAYLKSGVYILNAQYSYYIKSNLTLKANYKSTKKIKLTQTFKFYEAD